MDAYLKEYFENGYFIVRNAIEHETCDDAILSFKDFEKDYEELCKARINENKHYPRLANFHLYSSSARDVFSKCSILPVIDKIFNKELCIYTSLFYNKGSEQPLHRDTPYFCTRPKDKFIGMWVALEDVNLRNGPLCGVSESHKIESSDIKEMALKHFSKLDDIPPVSSVLWNEYQEDIQKKCDEKKLKSKAYQLKKGDVIVWHPLFFHGGEKMLDKKLTRYSIVVHLVPKGVRVHQGDVFFNPDKMIPFEEVEYLDHDSRKYMKHINMNPVFGEC